MKIRTLHNWIVGFWLIYEIIISNYQPENVVAYSKIISPIVGSVLLFIGFFFLLYNQEEGRVKKINEVTNGNNFGNYMQVFLILWQLELEVLHPVGTWIQLGIYSICLVLVLLVIINEYKTHKEILPQIAFYHLFLVYFLFAWGKNTYVQHYGNEIIGSYWAKPNFSAKYYVKISENMRSGSKYSFPALLNVSSETVESDFAQENEWGQEFYEIYDEEYIMLKKVYLKNGGHLVFEDCDLEMETPIYCTDQNNKGWYITLTDKKIN